MRPPTKLFAALAALAACADHAVSGADVRMAEASPLELDTALGERAWPDEQALTERLAAAIVAELERRYPPGEEVRRDAHPKAHGCVRATFRVEDALPDGLAVGAFRPSKSYDAVIRFSNANPSPTRPDDRPDARGMAIKLLDVPGEKVLEGALREESQDFVLIDDPVFFVDDPGRYLRLFERAASHNPLVRVTAPLALRPREMALAAKIASKRIANPLEERYWSTTAYRLGPAGQGRAVKYSARPCVPGTSDLPRKPDPDFLRFAMADRLARREACFDFLVQPAAAGMSVEDSRTEWSEAEAPFVKVATITIPPQAFDTPEQRRACEDLSFTPWHALVEHRPLGVVNRMRRVVYEEISTFRHARNGRPLLVPGASGP